MTRFRSASCEGERCFCGAPADHKVSEVVLHDDPRAQRGVTLFGDGKAVTTIRGFHELTAYLCRQHFVQIMGPAADV